MKIDIGAYIAIVTAIIAAFLTYRNQMRLKAFELFLNRRESVLSDIEKFIEKLFIIQNELHSNSDTLIFNKYKKEFFYEGLILYHKVKGANLGGPVDRFIETFWAIINEPISDKGIDDKDWIHRTLNILSALYGLGHRRLTEEIEGMYLSNVKKGVRKIINSIVALIKK